MVKSDEVRIRCRTQTRKRWKKMCADLDPDMTYEDVLVTILQAYDENPSLFEMMKDRPDVGDSL